MSGGKSGPTLAAGLAIWAIAILVDGDALAAEAWILFAALSLSAFALVLNSRDGDEPYRRPPP